MINTQDGRIAVVPGDREIDLPWLRIQGPDDASTMWYAVMRKREKGVFIGTLCFRHTERQASLEAAGWQEVSVDEIREGEAA